jgi:hypothetical protein
LKATGIMLNVWCVLFLLFLVGLIVAVGYDSYYIAGQLLIGVVVCSVGVIVNRLLILYDKILSNKKIKKQKDG